MRGNEETSVFLFPHCPVELVSFKPIFINEGRRIYDTAYESIIIAGKKHTGIESNFKNLFFKRPHNYSGKFVLGIGYRYYLAILAIYEMQLLDNKISLLSESECKKNTFKNINSCHGNIFKILKNKSDVLAHQMSKRKSFRLKVSMDIYFKNRLLKDKDIIVSEKEIKTFYEDYKWAFRKSMTKESSYYNLTEVKSFILEEIKRLKYYRLGELLSNPPKVEIIWKNPKSSQKKVW